MSEYTIDQEADAVALAVGDEWDVYQASASRIKKTNVGELLSFAAAVQVTAGATTLAITQALHSNRPVVLSNTAPIAITLPAATGSGARYAFFVNAAATATASTITSATTTDVMAGIAFALTTASANVVGYAATATSHIISLNGTTKGGVVGDYIELVDVKATQWYAELKTSPTGTTVTPFS